MIFALPDNLERTVLTMDVNYDPDGIRSQSQFCVELMLRLNEEIRNARDGYLSGMENHCRKQNDIQRIRRELLELGKMLDPWREG